MTILLVGYYGFNNVGDDICLQKSVSYLKEKYPKTPLCVLMKDPEEIPAGKFSFSFSPEPPFKGSAFLGDVTWCKRGSLSDIFSVIFRAKTCVFGGGEIFQDKTSLSSLLYYLFFMAIFILKRGKVEVIRNGFSPLRYRLSQRLLPFFLNRCASISVRDTESRQVLTDLGVKKAVSLESDLAFYKTTLPNATPLLGGECIGLALRKDILNAQPLLSYLQRELSNSRFLSTQLSDESDLIPFLGSKFDFESDFHVLTLKNFFTISEDYRLKLLISMRYHACIWAAIRGIPFIALSTDPKCVNFARDCGQLYVDRLEVSEFKRVFKTFNKRYSSLKMNLIERVPDVIRRGSD